jgi:hypothetical protein
MEEFTVFSDEAIKSGAIPTDLSGVLRPEHDRRVQEGVAPVGKRRLHVLLTAGDSQDAEGRLLIVHEGCPRPDDNRLGMRVEVLDLPPCAIRLSDIVRIQASHELTRRCLQTSIVCRGESPTGSVNEPDAPVVKRRNDRPRGIDAAVINKDELEIAVVLVQNAGHSGDDIALGVPSDHDV